MAAAAAAVRRKPGQPVRHDPKPKHIDGTSPLMRLKNKNPNKVYIGANIADREYGLARYKAMGWQVEVYTGEPNCLQFVGGQTCPKGDPLESMGHVIVSISKERWEEIQEFGDDGGGGQADVDRTEEAIVDKRSGMIDLVRGMNGSRNYFSARNQTTPLQEEWIGGEAERADVSDPFGE